MDKILVTRSIMPGIDEYVDEIRSIWDTHWMTNMGPKHQELEEKLREYLEVKELSLFSNGHMALELAIQAMKLKGEVITTPFTFASTTHAIVRNGLTPVFCDIRKEDFTLDPSKIENLITDNTSAIVPVHVYGKLCDVEAIERIAKKHGLKVIYDAAHAFGVKKNGISVGNFGDASMFSFHATKVYNSIEGGAVAFRNKSFGLDLYRLKNFGIRDEETIDEVGANAKMNEFQAAMGLCNLRHVDEEIAKRKGIVERYEERLKGVRGIHFCEPQKGVESNYAYLPVIIDPTEFGATRNEIYDRLKEKNIHTRKYFYPLTNTLQCYNRRYNPADTPVALHISRRVLTLPLYGDLPLEEVDRICQEIKRIGNA